MVFYDVLSDATKRKQTTFFAFRIGNETRLDSVEVKAQYRKIVWRIMNEHWNHLT